MPSKPSRQSDDDDDFEYEPSNSEDDETPQDRKIIGEVLGRNAEESDSEVEVYGVRSSSDDSDIALSDVEGQDQEDDLPNIRAWGKDKRHFYSTDYIDQDYGGYQGQDAVLADFEEEEAKNLQKQLLEQMDDDDFDLGIVSKPTKKEDQQTAEVVKTDISKLSKRQKIELFHKESPEFFGLVDDFRSKMQILADFLSPILLLSKKGKVVESNALQFVRVYNEIISNYCTNINMYLLLKSSRVNVQNHPVIKRLYQYRKLLAQLDPVFEEVIKSQIETLIKTNENCENAQPKKVLKLLRKLGKKDKRSNRTDDVPEESKKQKMDVEEDDVEEKDTEEVEDGEDEDSRRAITYQIAKNKGLTPHRNKLQRNPRVKNRNKYRRALIRRKGAVREVRTEMSRYGGELSGIKASVSKSIKIKS